MTGAPEREYVAARRALIDALEAIGPQRRSAVLVGAQAIYLHTGDDESIPVSPFTTDADISLDPQLLSPDPLLQESLIAAGFKRSDNLSMVGTWIAPNGVLIDFMVPEAVAGEGNRSADISPHQRGTARRARGLEGALVERDRRLIESLDPADSRSFELWVAGPGALIVAKALKIADRLDRPSRLANKDALDLFRLLRAFSTNDLATSLRRLREHPLSGEVTMHALTLLAEHFGKTEGRGVQLVVDATTLVADPSEMAASCVVLTNDLLDALQG
jgi:hypothetical protein